MMMFMYIFHVHVYLPLENSLKRGHFCISLIFLYFSYYSTLCLSILFTFHNIFVYILSFIVKIGNWLPLHSCHFTNECFILLQVQDLEYPPTDEATSTSAKLNSDEPSPAVSTESTGG